MGFVFFGVFFFFCGGGEGLKMNLIQNSSSTPSVRN